jgi:uncharacterized membrane protein YidH (DUF202 family)
MTTQDPQSQYYELKAELLTDSPLPSLSLPTPEPVPPKKEEKTSSVACLGWVTVKNTGSTSRDLLALGKCISFLLAYCSERTNLAWTRTALSCIGLGISIAKLVRSSSGINEISLTVTGCIFILFGLFIFLYSFIRTMYGTNNIRKGIFSVDLFNPFTLFAFGSAVSILALVLIFV